MDYPLKMNMGIQSTISYNFDTSNDGTTHLGWLPLPHSLRSSDHLDLFVPSVRTAIAQSCASVSMTLHYGINFPSVRATLLSGGPATFFLLP